jgi:hypothetical protein
VIDYFSISKMNSEFFAFVGNYQQHLVQSSHSKASLKTELLQLYNKIGERKNARVGTCDYCGGKSQVFLNIGKDLKSLGWKDDAEHWQISCCASCTIKYMGTFNYLFGGR